MTSHSRLRKEARLAERLAKLQRLGFSVFQCADGLSVVTRGKKLLLIPTDVAHDLAYAIMAQAERVRRMRLIPQRLVVLRLRPPRNRDIAVLLAETGTGYKGLRWNRQRHQWQQHLSNISKEEIIGDALPCIERDRATAALQDHAEYLRLEERRRSGIPMDYPPSKVTDVNAASMEQLKALQQVAADAAEGA